MFAMMTDALARHLHPEVAGFGDLGFSMHDVDELSELMRSSASGTLMFRRVPKPFVSRRPPDFLWQYINNTPLAEEAAQAGEARTH